MRLMLSRSARAFGLLLILLAVLTAIGGPARVLAQTQQVCSTLEATPDADEEYWIIWPENWQHSAPSVLQGGYLGSLFRPDQDVTLESSAAPSATLSGGSTHTYSASGISELSIHAPVSFTLYACIPLAMAISPTSTPPPATSTPAPATSTPTPTSTPTAIPTVELRLSAVLTTTQGLVEQQIELWTPAADTGPLFLGLAVLIFVFGLLMFIKQLAS